MISDYVWLRFRARTPENLSAIEVIFIIIIIMSGVYCSFRAGHYLTPPPPCYRAY